MFKFKKVRGPERPRDMSVDLAEPAANLIEKNTETTRTGKSRLLLQVRNVSDRLTGMPVIRENAPQIKCEIEPQSESLESKHADMMRKIDELAIQIVQVESRLAQFNEINEDFEKTVAKISRESARITTWMAANEKMASDLARTDENLEVTRQKVDNLHELTEYIDTKTKSLGKHKELLKIAHMELCKANIILVDIKSRLAELENDSKNIKEIQGDAGAFEKALKSLETRFNAIDSKSDELNGLLKSFARLESYAEKIQKKQKHFESLDQLADGLTRAIKKQEVDLSALSDKTITLERQFDRALDIEKKMAEFEDSLDKKCILLNNLAGRVIEVSEIQKRVDELNQQILDLETKLSDIARKSSEIDKLQKQFNRINLLAEELKARERILVDDERLISTAIAAAANLEEPVHKAELLTKKSQ
jgi:chromosome segregation ATPase